MTPSERDLGAELLQEVQPIAFFGRALTDTETRYAQIEKEMLAIVFAAEKFDQYTFGHSVTVQSNHKPLESITWRSGYSVHLSVREEWLCDTRKATLSRAFLSAILTKLEGIRTISNTSAWYSTCQLLNYTYSKSSSIRPRMSIFNNCEQWSWLDGLLKRKIYHMTLSCWNCW